MMKFFILLFSGLLLFSIPSFSQTDQTDPDVTQPDQDDSNSNDDNTPNDDDNANDSDDDDKDEKDKEEEEEEEKGHGHHVVHDEHDEKENEKDSDTSKTKWKFKYRIALDGVTTRGNVNRSLITFRNILGLERKRFSANLNTYAATGSQSKTLAEEELLNNFTLHHYLSKKIYALGINTFEHSHLRGINLRWQAGGGFGINIWSSDTNSLTISNAFLYESTDFRKIEDINTIRNSTRIKGLHSFRHKHLVLLHETFFQPSILDINNITFRTNITLSLPISRLTSLRFTCNDSYETIIQPGKKHNDLQLTFGFSISN